MGAVCDSADGGGEVPAAPPQARPAQARAPRTEKTGRMLLMQVPSLPPAKRWEPCPSSSAKVYRIDRNSNPWGTRDPHRDPTLASALRGRSGGRGRRRLGLGHDDQNEDFIAKETSIRRPSLPAAEVLSRRRWRHQGDFPYGGRSGAGGEQRCFRRTLDFTRPHLHQTIVRPPIARTGVTH